MIKDKTYGKIRFYFGSQSGTAERYSNILAEEATANDFLPQVIDLTDFSPDYTN